MKNKKQYMSEIPQPAPETELRSFKAAIANSSEEGRYVEIAQKKGLNDTVESIIENDTSGVRREVPTTLVEVATGIERDTTGSSEMVNLLGERGLYMASIEVKPIATADQLLSGFPKHEESVSLPNLTETPAVEEPKASVELPSLAVNSKPEEEPANEQLSDAEISKLKDESEKLINDVVSAVEQQPGLLEALQNQNFGSEIGTLRDIFRSAENGFGPDAAERIMSVLNGLRGSQLTVENIGGLVESLKSARAKVTELRSAVRETTGDELMETKTNTELVAQLLDAGATMRGSLDDLRYLTGRYRNTYGSQNERVGFAQTVKEKYSLFSNSNTTFINALYRLLQNKKDREEKVV